MHAWELWIVKYNGSVKGAIIVLRMYFTACCSSTSCGAGGRGGRHCVVEGSIQKKKNRNKFCQPVWGGIIIF